MGTMTVRFEKALVALMGYELCSCPMCDASQVSLVLRIEAHAGYPHQYARIICERCNFTSSESLRKDVAHVWCTTSKWILSGREQSGLFVSLLGDKN